MITIDELYIRPIWCHKIDSNSVNTDKDMTLGNVV